MYTCKLFPALRIHFTPAHQHNHPHNQAEGKWCATYADPYATSTATFPANGVRAALGPVPLCQINCSLNLLTCMCWPHPQKATDCRMGANPETETATVSTIAINILGAVSKRNVSRGTKFTHCTLQKKPQNQFLIRKFATNTFVAPDYEKCTYIQA